MLREYRVNNLYDNSLQSDELQPRRPGSNPLLMRAAPCAKQCAKFALVVNSEQTSRPICQTFPRPRQRGLRECGALSRRTEMCNAITR